jgi:hypothetical protein
LLAWNAANPGQPHPEIHVGNRSMLRAPFGAAVALGTAVITMVQVWR